VIISLESAGPDRVSGRAVIRLRFKAGENRARYAAEHPKADLRNLPRFAAC